MCTLYDPRKQECIVIIGITSCEERPWKCKNSYFQGYTVWITIYA